MSRTFSSTGAHLKQLPATLRTGRRVRRGDTIRAWQSGRYVTGPIQRFVTDISGGYRIPVKAVVRNIHSGRNCTLPLTIANPV